MPQNDHLNYSFVKDIHIVGKKMARNGQKTAFYQLIHYFFCFCPVLSSNTEVFVVFEYLVGLCKKCISQRLELLSLVAQRL